jgi:hypothetical protein
MHRRFVFADRAAFGRPTTLQIRCERQLTSCKNTSEFIDLAMLTNALLPPRSLLQALVGQRTMLTVS